MQIRSEILDTQTQNLLQKVAQFFCDKQRTAFLVGGSVRNLLLGIPCTDWDITTDGEAPSLARKLANQLGGYYAHMHEKASRIVIKHEQPGKEIILDIASLHDNSIEADLAARDFTINAIALPLAQLCTSDWQDEPLQMIDLLQGAADLATHTLRAVNDHIFLHDPLRLLRAMRFSMRYALTIDPHTRTLIQRDASLLSRVAAERIHDELYALLVPPGATGRLRTLDALGLFMTLFPEFLPARGMPQPGLHHWDVFDHSLETVAMLERLAETLQQPLATIEQSPMETAAGDLRALRELLDEAALQGIFARDALTTPAMKLAALLHDIGKPATYEVDEQGIHFYGHPQVGIPIAQQIMHRLGASTQDRRLVQQVVAHHMRPGQLGRDMVTPRAIRRYFLDLGPTGIAVALISLADHLSMRGPEPLQHSWARHLASVRLLLTRYIRERQSILPPRLVQGEELLHRFKLQPGPLIGQLLEAVAEAQADGLIHSRTEAFWLIEEKLRGKP
jgi:poly(A) polymerase